MTGASALLAVVLLTGTNRVLMENLSATDSGTQLRAAYALGHLYDPASSNESQAVKNLLLTGNADQQNAAADGALHRHWGGALPGDLVESIWHPTIRRPPPPPFRMTGIRTVPPLGDPLLLLPPEKRREIRARTAGMTNADLDWADHREDKEWLAARLKSTGEWDRQRIALSQRPMTRPVCFEGCINELMFHAWLGMDMGPILEIRKPPTMETHWWTETLMRLVRGAGGDAESVSTLARDSTQITDPQARRALVVLLVNLPPGTVLHPGARSAVISAASQSNDPELRRYAVELLAARPEMHRHPGADAAFVAALSDRNPDVRIRAACGLWDIAPLDPGIAASVTAAASREGDPVVSFALRAALERK